MTVFIPDFAFGIENNFGSQDSGGATHVFEGA